MKKIASWTLAALLVVAFTIPAWSMESQFGGYWRTRMYTQQNFSGEDESESQDVSAVDTRTRLYYTAIFNENLKFVNKFEFDATWGSGEGSRKGTGERGYGQFSADGANIEIKNSYADFNLGPVNAKVGVQGYVMARGFLMDDDFAGMVVAYENDMMSLPFIWAKAYEGGMGKDANDHDVDMYGFNPSFNIGSISINPFGLYVYSKDANEDTTIDEEIKMWYAGLNFDADFDMASFWATGIYQGGDTTTTVGGVETSVDYKAWLAAVGASVNMGIGDVHGEFFYASGDDDAADDDMETFWVPYGQSYYWSEIMGYGILGDTSYAQVSNNAPADQISNVMAANLGVTIKPVDKLAVTLDVWYAALAEDIKVKGEDENYLGTEVDLKITYELVEGLTLDVVGAYLFAGKATTLDVEDEADPYEIGTRLSLKF